MDALKSKSRALRLKSSRKRKALVKKVMRFLCLAAVLCLVALIVFCVKNWLKTSAAFNVEKIEIRGNNILTREEILALANLKTPQRIFDIDLAAMEKRIQRHPFVKEVSVVRSFPATLKIYVIEREPIVSLSSSKELLYLDSHGYLLPHLSEKYYDLPIITGTQKPKVGLGEQINSERILQAIRFLRVIKATEPSLFSKISEINLASSKGMILYITGNKIPIIFGQNEYRTKVQYLKAILNHIQSQGNWDNIVSIDLRFKGQVVVKGKS